MDQGQGRRRNGTGKVSPGGCRVPAREQVTKWQPAGHPIETRTGFEYWEEWLRNEAERLIETGKWTDLEIVERRPAGRDPYSEFAERYLALFGVWIGPPMASPKLCQHYMPPSSFRCPASNERDYRHRFLGPREE